ncbi:MAG: glutamate ABC transporter substrate-binding protein [Pseudonocardiaceae bacterium]
MIARFPLACSVLVAVALATVASDQRPDRPVPVVAGPVLTTAVRPAVGDTADQAAAMSDCNPQNLRASLRPQGPLPAPGQMPAGSAMARIAKRGYLIAGVLRDTYPFAFRDINLRPEGFDIDVARDITEAMFGDRERVVFRPLREAARLDMTTSGQVDLVVATVTITCKRRQRVDFSAVYYEAGQRVLVNRGLAITSLADLRGKEVCAARGSTSLERILADPAKPIPVAAATATDCLMLLQLGSVDAVSTDDTLLAGMAAQDPRTEVIGPQLAEEPYGIAIKKDAPELVRFVNAVLERRAADGRWRASYERWLTPLGPAPSPPAPQYRD